MARLLIQDISAARNIAGTGWVLVIECADIRYSAPFDSMDGLLRASAEGVQYFATQLGQMRAKSRPLAHVKMEERPGMHLDTFTIGRSILGWKIEATCNGCSSTLDFDDFGGYLMAITDMVKFFGVRAGAIRAKDANLTLKVVPGAMDNTLLPGEKV